MGEIIDNDPKSTAKRIIPRSRMSVAAIRSTDHNPFCGVLQCPVTLGVLFSLSLSFFFFFFFTLAIFVIFIYLYTFHMSELDEKAPTEQQSGILP